MIADRLFILFTLEPVLRGFIAMVISGISFPLCGVMVLRLDLVPLRYMLMHGVILGGALSLALNLPLLPVTVLINLLLIFVMIFFTQNQNFGFSGSSAGVMVLSMALASLIMHVKNVPAKDTLSLMWGSPFALSKADVVILLALALFLILYVILNFQNILCLFFNQEITKSMGIKTAFHRNLMIIIIALTVALAMKLLGAFLIDSLLILPVLTSSLLCGKKSGGIKKLFVLSSILGFSFSVIGYFLAVLTDWPPAATISLLSGLFFVILSLIQKLAFK